MSLNDFNRRARLELSVNISGSGQFSPTTYVPENWTLEGTVVSREPDISLTAREETCGVPYGSPKEFRLFLMRGSTGNTSGTIETGQLPYTFSRGSSTLLGRTFLGEWTVNTSPVLESGGKIDGDVVEGSYYIVATPENATADDPIEINPPIDNLTRVYPGDAVYVFGTGVFAAWSVAPQQRYPKPDRTFFWTPNSAPVLASGGIADGELALPGSIMIPTEDHYIEPPAEAIDGMRYFFGGIGIEYDGQIWRAQHPQPLVYEPETGPREARVVDLRYVSDQTYQSLLENEQADKPFLFCNIPIDDAQPVVYTVTPEGGEPYTTDLYFRWGSPANGAETNIQPSVNPVHDFGDAWSGYHLATRDWLKSRFPSLVGASFSLESVAIEPAVLLQLGVNCVEDGNITETTETIEWEGQTLTNTITVTLNITTQLA
jgi:hypothetical protein